MRAPSTSTLVDGFHVLARHDLGARIAGHLTLRHPEQAAFWTHRFGLGFEEIAEPDLVLCDFALRAAGEAAPVNPTMHIHAQIYRARPDVAAIVHTHGPAVVALSAVTSEFVACSQMAGIFHDDIAIVDEADLVVLSPGAGEEMAALLGRRGALILRNHGSLVVGSSVPEAVLKTIALEEAAGVQLRAMAAGPMRGLPPAAAEQVRRFVLSPAITAQYWDYEIRKLGPDRAASQKGAH